MVMDSVRENCGGCGLCRGEVWWLWVLGKHVCFSFSGFSVGFCINEEKVICYQLELGK